MADHVNTGFETAYTGDDGDATGWTRTSSSAMEAAGYIGAGGNLQASSEDFTAVGWVKTAATIAGDTVAGPAALGAVLADTLKDTGAASVHRVAHNTLSIPGMLPDHIVGVSVWAKKAGPVDWVYIAFESSTGWFDLANGVVGSFTGDPLLFIEDFGSGWYRCHLLGYRESGFGFTIGASDTDGATSYTGTTVDVLHLYGAQVAVIEIQGLSIEDIEEVEAATFRPYVASTPGISLPASTPFDSFEIFWDTNEEYYFDFSSIDSTAAAYAIVTVGDAAFDSFEELWDGNESYLFALGAVTTAVYANTPNANFDSFEDEWDGITGGVYYTSLPAVTAAGYDPEVGAATEAFEDFEEEWGARETHFVDADFANDEFDYPGAVAGVVHVTDEPVQFENQGGQTLPSGFSFLTTYYARAATAFDFELAAAPAGVAITFTDNGTGGPFLVRRLGGNFYYKGGFVAADLTAATYGTGSPVFETFVDVGGTEWPTLFMVTV